MKGLLRVLAVAVLVFFIVLFSTLTITVIRKAWFGKSSGGGVAVLDISGVITNSQSKIRELDKILDGKNAKAIVVRVNSPGGLVAPSQELYEALKRADQKVPVVISMGPLAASGGYYLALGGRKIVANPGTLTASIGVIIEFVNTQKLLEWAKVERYSITSGKFKSIGSPFRPMTPDEKQLLTQMVADIYGQFRGTVKERRKLTDEELVTAADGRVMTGSQALQARLVDKLGDLETAVTWAKELAQLPKEAPVDFLESQPGLLFKLLLGDDASKGDALLESLRAKSDAYLPSPVWRLLLLAPVG